MIEPYNAVGLVPTFWGIRRREDIQKNISHIKSLTKAAFWLSNLDIPVRLLAIPEGGLQGFNDEVLDADHAEYARTCAVDIPGRETDQLGELAREYRVFIIAQMKARHADWPDRFLNVGFVINPDGEVVPNTTRCPPYFRASARCHHTISLIGGLRNMDVPLMRSGRCSTPRSDASAS